MSDDPTRDDEPLRTAIQQALDERRDPWADGELAQALADHPRLAAELLRLGERLELLPLVDEPTGGPLDELSPTGVGPASGRRAGPASAGDRSPRLLLLPVLAVAAVVLLALRLVLAGDSSDLPPGTVGPAVPGPGAVAAHTDPSGDPGLGTSALHADLAASDAAATRPPARVLDWSLRVSEHRPGLELRRERGPGHDTLTARDHRGAVAMTTLRSLR